jgi:hypothetical protein
MDKWPSQDRAGEVSTSARVRLLVLFLCFSHIAVHICFFYFPVKKKNTRLSSQFASHRVWRFL